MRRVVAQFPDKACLPSATGNDAVLALETTHDDGVGLWICGDVQKEEAV